MSASRHFNRIAWAVTALMLALTIAFMNGGALGLTAAARTMGYEERLFDQSAVHTLDIVMDDWDELIENATQEEYYNASVVIDGEAYQNVGIRAKGNTSLTTVASLGSERYSFKLEFDHYDGGQTYHGLDKLSLNNLIQDSTMMKDYLTYTMMNAFGVNAPLCSYVFITVNGEDWGLYLAVEGVEEAFLERNYGADYGELYKPDSQSFGGGRGNGGGFDMADLDFDFDFDFDFDVTPGDAGGADAAAAPGAGELPAMGGQPDDVGGFGGGMTPPDGASVPDFGDAAPDGDTAPELPADFDPSGLADLAAQADGMGGGMGADDVKLQYIDDDPDSYTNLWDNAKTDVSAADQARLIESLKKLSAGEDIASVVDVEQVLRYFVVHNFVCNGDSYTGSMVHNYYLYECDGQLAMIPWDYNLAFGTFQGGLAQSAVNTPIDAPVSGGTGEDRPMWSWIVSDERYTALYHQYFAEFLAGVDIDGIISGAYALIRDYVAKDPTAFYTPDEFEQGVQTLRSFCALRGESIALQLENGATTSDMGYVDASALSLSDMGTMNNGGGMGEMPAMGGQPDASGDFGGEMPAMGGQPDDAGDFGGERPTRGDAAPSAPDSASAPGDAGGASIPVGAVLLAVSLLVLAAGLVIAKLYKV